MATTNKKTITKKAVNKIVKKAVKGIKKDAKKIVKVAQKKVGKAVEKSKEKKNYKSHVSEKEIKVADREVYDAIREEYKRELYRLELIASENIVSRAVMEAQGSIMTNKYAEGYPKARYYGGCEAVDKVEILAQERAKKLFKCNHINVQPHSGSQANMGVFQAILKHGDTYMGLSLDCGGHLTHGSKVNFSGINYNVVAYGLDKNTMQIDYNEVERLALEHRPKLIITGGSAYPRLIDFKKFRAIADKIGAYFMVDMAHFGGLVAAGLIESPVPYAHFITGTTHKTLRGPRGGYIIATDTELAKKIDKTIFPGIQGGPLMHVIAAKAVCFKECLSKEYIEYQKQVMKNAKVMAEEFIKRGYSIVSDGTDTHLILLDVKTSKGITGNIAEKALDEAHITTNKNGIPYDTEPPKITSGVRLGTPAVTTRGFKEREIVELVGYIDTILSNVHNEKVIKEIAKKVDSLCERFPIYNYMK